jgi:hypothetical protein
MRLSEDAAFCRPVDVRSKQRVFGKMKQERSTVYRVHPDNQPSKGIAELSTVRVLASYLRQEQTVQKQRIKMQGSHNHADLVRCTRP